MNNTADYGGSIYISNQSSVLINTSNFYNNTGLTGGAIYNIGILNIFNSNFKNNKAKSKLYVNSKSYVNCSDDAFIKVTLEGGNNIINAIWSKNQININDTNINPNHKISSQIITLNIEGKIYTSKTNNNGEAVFKFNTINFKIKNYICIVLFSESNDYFGSSYNFNLKITTKIVYITKLKNIKKIKKVKKYQVYSPSTKYIRQCCLCTGIVKNFIFNNRVLDLLEEI